MKKRWLQAFGMGVLLVGGGVYALASWNWCGVWPSAPPVLTSNRAATGTLRAGAATVDIDVPFPIVAAGYGPVRSTATGADRPLRAHALVFEVDGFTFGLVTLDVLLIPAPLVSQIRAASGLNAVWVSATHTHGSFGGYDPRPLAQLAGTGRTRDDASRALVSAASAALMQAHRSLTPAELFFANSREPGLCRPRSSDACDEQLSALKVETADGGALAQWVVASAHPTLTPRRLTALSADWPGALDESLAGVTLVTQGSAGNASAADAGTPADFAVRVSGRLAAQSAQKLEQPLTLSVTTATLALPRPDGSRLVPGFSRAIATNFFCLDAAHDAELSVLALGPLKFLSVPAEPSLASGTRLNTAAGTVRTVSLTNGYVGYVEPVDIAKAATGESKRQYYSENLQDLLEAAARLAGGADAGN